MSSKVTSIQLGNEFNAFTYDWLRHNRGEKIPIIIEFEVSTAAKLWSENAITYNPDEFVTDDFIQSEFDLFGDFYVGDTIKITDVTIPARNGNYTIIEKRDNRTLRLNTTFPNGTTLDAIIEVIDVVDKIKFNWNLIENSAALNFLSLVDGNIQQAEADGLDASDVSVISLYFKGEKSWQIGSLNVEGVGIETSPVYKSKFKITGNIYLTPFFLAEEWNDLLARINPSYFLNFKCLRFVCRGELSYVGRNPQFFQSFEISKVLGESGGYDENFDLTDSNYSIESIVFENSAPSIPLVSSDTDFTIVVKNTIDTPFSAGSKFILNFAIAPENQSEYQNNGKTLDYNFRFDRVVQIVGASNINGEQYGVANRQVFKDVHCLLYTTDQITIEGKISLDPELVIYMKTLDNPRYLIWVTIGQVSITPSFDKTFQNGDGFEFQDSDIYEFQ